jgi:hypothetical protein
MEGRANRSRIMKSILRKLRGAFGTAVTWAVGWAAGGFVLATILAILSPGFDIAIFTDWALTLTALGGGWGLVGGTAFSIALGSVHRRRQLGELRSAQMGLWGALAGLMVPLGAVSIGLGMGTFLFNAQELITTIVFFGATGVATAVGTVKIAQNADRQISGQGLEDALPSGE